MHADLVAAQAHQRIEGDAQRVNQVIMQGLRHADKMPIGPAALIDIARDITAVGSPIVLSLLVISTTLGLRLARQHLMAGAVLASSVSGFGAAMLMKTVIARGRPEPRLPWCALVSDVVGGWIAGAVWALAYWIVEDRLSQGMRS